jgi:hypothetical protein
VDCDPDILAFMGAQIIHYDDVALFEDRDKDLVDISFEARAIHGSVKNHRRSQTIDPEPGCKSSDFPMPVRGGPAQTLAAQRPASQPYHVGRTACFIDKDQLFRLKASLAFAPTLPCQSDVRARLFAGQNRFF